ncbi:MAG: flagellar hook-associated protein FlgK [Candidatus Hydrogenedentes bacterium]|nr:flagellar hook-associated protein FlgK [Candidatus Hydrogenedentota bacterium]
MGTLFSALDIARSGMLVAQVQLDVTGHNIANANTEGYSRQRVDVTTQMPNYRPYGVVGRGPAVAGINRIRETFLDSIYRQQYSAFGRCENIATYFTRIEDIFQEPGENGFSSRLARFFDALQDFAGNVEQDSVRVSLVTEGVALANSLNELARQIYLIESDVNEEIRTNIEQINSLLKRIAEYNRNIRDSEISGKKANDLRDGRDLLLDQLSKIISISTRERDDGQVDVILGGVEIVGGTRYRALKAVVDNSIDPSRPDFLSVVFEDNNEKAIIPDGTLAGMLRVRDNYLREIKQQLDELTKAIVGAINSIHSQGRGLELYSTTLASYISASSSTIPLSNLNLPFDINNGSFQILVYDSLGNLAETLTISVDPNTNSLNDITASINASSYLSASINPQGYLSISPNPGYSFRFANDSSGFLNAFQLNPFFTGYTAKNISVNPELIRNPRLLSSGTSSNNSETGDNTSALAMAQLRTRKILSNSTQTADEFYQSLIVKVGVNARSNLDILEMERNFIRDFSQRRQEVSGVNLDEEVTNLLLFQRAYEASARIVVVTDRMLEALLNII